MLSSVAHVSLWGAEFSTYSFGKPQGAQATHGATRSSGVLIHAHRELLYRAKSAVGPSATSRGDPVMSASRGWCGRVANIGWGPSLTQTRHPPLSATCLPGVKRTCYSQAGGRANRKILMDYFAEAGLTVPADESGWDFCAERAGAV